MKHTVTKEGGVEDIEAVVALEAVSEDEEVEAADFIEVVVALEAEEEDVVFEEAEEEEVLAWVTNLATEVMKMSQSKSSCTTQ